MFFVIFVIEFWRISLEARSAKKQGQNVQRSGRFFSYFYPRTITIYKGKHDEKGIFK